MLPKAEVGGAGQFIFNQLDHKEMTSSDAEQLLVDVNKIFTAILLQGAVDEKFNHPPQVFLLTLACKCISTVIMTERFFTEKDQEELRRTVLSEVMTGVDIMLKQWNENNPLTK